MNTYSHQSVEIDQTYTFLLKKNVEILAERLPEFSEVIRAWDQDFFKILHLVIEENWKFVRELKSRGKGVYGLANFAHNKFKQALEVFPELKELNDIAISSELHFRKPEEGIYYAALKQFNIDPESTGFIDDCPLNVRAAEKCGIEGYQYFDPVQLSEFINKADSW